MDRNTILAVVLSSLVLIVFFALQGMFMPPPPPEPAQSPAVVGTPQESTQPTPPLVTPQASTQLDAALSSQELLAQATAQITSVHADAGPQVVEYVTINTDLLTVVLTSAGGDVVSWKLNEHFDKDENVNMVLAGTNEARAFSVALGGLDAQPISSFFYVNRVSEYIVEFYRDFIYPGTNGVFRLTKRYEFKPREYMFELTVTLDGGHSVPAFNIAGNAYTLIFGPQIGPKFEKLDNRYDYRQYITYTNGRRRNVKINDIIDTRPSWAAISGKYFIFMAIPYLTQYNIVFSEAAEPGLVSASRFNLIRPAAGSSRISDTYRFYLGPKSQEMLAVYNNGRNDFGLFDTGLVDAASTRGILAPLERALKWFLLVFYRIVGNYGIAIIMITLLVKIVFFPLTKKGSEATIRMQALAPKIKELQEKHKGNPQKLNAEMAAFYKSEGYNPLSGCLPLLLQMPIFFAMYNLFNNHFDLRGAAFIPGWIPDLSVPEVILNFPEGFSLPFLGWTALRGLPFVYVGSQLLYGKVTQMPGQQSNTQMKMMLYVMPIVFFFILYDVPSGLLIYWIFSNLLTLVQQVIINKYIVKKKAAAQLQQPVQPAAPPARPPGTSAKKKKK